jgi:DNA-binding LacI/PurR family transcriptional regulator
MAPKRPSQSDVAGSTKSAGRRSTLRDVARLAGVSPMTVSNVVNGTLRGYNDETRNKVMHAIELASYRPDIAARSLRTDRRMSVGMLVVQNGRRFLADPYITNLLDGLCASLNQRGYSMVLQGLHPDEVATSSLVQQLQTDGLCILMSGDFLASGAFRSVVIALRQPISAILTLPVVICSAISACMFVSVDIGLVSSRFFQ